MAFGPPLPPNFARLHRAHRIRRGRHTVAAFNQELTDWANKAVPEHVLRVSKWLAMEALTRIVARTPVDTGRARGGWFVTLSTTSDAPTGAVDPTGGGAINAGASKIGAAKPFQVIWIQNNVEYIRILEEGGFVPTDPGPSKSGGSASKAGREARKGKTLVEGGFSAQAPEGMVAITLRELMGVFA